MKLALAQINTTVSDFEGNARRIVEAAHQASAAGADLLVLPEMAVTGYPPQDLLDRADFLAAALHTHQLLAAELPPLPTLLGSITANTGPSGKALHNAALYFAGGQLLAERHKTLLPTYDVFDEARHFEPAATNSPLLIGGKRCMVTICEDLWNEASYWRRPLYPRDPLREADRQPLDLILNLSASPFEVGKLAAKRRMFAHTAQRYGATLVHVNLVGGNDSLIFDGGSCVFSPRGELIAEASRFSEDLLLLDLGEPRSALPIIEPPPAGQVFQALALGVRDYFQKTGFRSTVVGLSGGIDSAVTAAIAVEALGREQVLGVLMPGPFSSPGSIEDAAELARHLGIATRTVAITPVYESYLHLFEQLHPGQPFGTTEENVQARIRGNILMAISNREGQLVLSTGNKSELAVGYCTLYGDMSGGLAVIGDLPKGMVYEVARHLNRAGEIIPEATISKPPSAELRPNQRDQDSLPEYEVLDRVVTAYIEEGRSREELVAEGIPAAEVDRLIRLINASEYKRKQAAPVLKVSPRAFGIGRRFPIARKLLP